MESMDEKTVYFRPGDCVKLRQYKQMHSPVMLVLRKEVALFKNKDNMNNKDSLKGIKCRWFTDSGLMQEAVFNTKDLIKVE